MPGGGSHGDRTLMGVCLSIHIPRQSLAHKKFRPKESGGALPPELDQGGDLGGPIHQPPKGTYPRGRSVQPQNKPYPPHPPPPPPSPNDNPPRGRYANFTFRNFRHSSPSHGRLSGIPRHEPSLGGWRRSTFWADFLSPEARGGAVCGGTSHIGHTEPD